MSLAKALLTTVLFFSGTALAADVNTSVGVIHQRQLESLVSEVSNWHVTVLDSHRVDRLKSALGDAVAATGLSQPFFEAYQVNMLLGDVHQVQCKLYLNKETGEAFFAKPCDSTNNVYFDVRGIFTFEDLGL